MEYRRLFRWIIYYRTNFNLRQHNLTQQKPRLTVLSDLNKWFPVISLNKYFLLGTYYMVKTMEVEEVNMELRFY